MNNLSPVWTESKQYTTEHNYPKSENLITFDCYIIIPQHILNARTLTVGLN